MATKNCLVTFCTSNGRGAAELCVNSQHQLALLMPATVISYEVQDNGECARSHVNDNELYDLLLGLVGDLDSQVLRQM